MTFAENCPFCGAATDVLDLPHLGVFELRCGGCGAACRIKPDFLPTLFTFTESEKAELSRSLRTLFTRNPAGELFVLRSGRDVMEANWLASVPPERRGH